MKKIKLLFVAFFLVLTAGSAMAQKIGYISIEQVVMLMPETAKLDSLLRRYQADSLNPQYAYLISEYQRKDTMVNTMDSVKLTKKVKDQIRQEMEGIRYQVENWQGFAQQAIQGKQQEYLEPIYKKVDAAVQAVAKENGYAYVVNREVLIVMPPADDLFPLVVKKLNLKVPAQTAATPR